MWIPNRIEFRKNSLSSTLFHINNQEVTQLFLGNELICNSLIHVEYANEYIQFKLCESCYETGCSSSDWINIKRSNTDLLFIPPFKEMLNEKNSNIYGFPYYMKKRRIVLLKNKIKMKLCDRIPFFNCTENFEPLSQIDILYSLQLEAPCNCLGGILNPVRFNHDLFLSTNDDSGRRILKILQNSIDDYLENDQPVKLIEQSGEEEIIIYLDNQDFTEFKPLYKINNTYHLRLEPGYIIQPIEE